MNRNETQTNTDGATVKFEPKLPLWSVIASAVAVVFSMGGVIVKLDSIGVSLVKLEQKTDTRDERIQTVQQTVLTMQGKNDMQDAQLSRIAVDFADMKRDVEEIRKHQRWAPK